MRHLWSEATTKPVPLWSIAATADWLQGNGFRPIAGMCPERRVRLSRRNARFCLPGSGLWPYVQAMREGSESGSKDSDAGRFSSMSVSTGFLHMLVHVGSGEGEQHAEYNRQREHCRRGDSRVFPSQRPAGEKQTDQGCPHGMNVVAE